MIGSFTYRFRFLIQNPQLENYALTLFQGNQHAAISKNVTVFHNIFYQGKKALISDSIDFYVVSNDFPIIKYKGIEKKLDYLLLRTISDPSQISYDNIFIENLTQPIECVMYLKILAWKYIISRPINSLIKIFIKLSKIPQNFSIKDNELSIHIFIKINEIIFPLTKADQITTLIDQPQDVIYFSFSISSLDLGNYSSLVFQLWDISKSFFGKEKITQIGQDIEVSTNDFPYPPSFHDNFFLQNQFQIQFQDCVGNENRDKFDFPVQIDFEKLWKHLRLKFKVLNTIKEDKNVNSTYSLYDGIFFHLTHNLIQSIYDQQSEQQQIQRKQFHPDESFKINCEDPYTALFKEIKEVGKVYDEMTLKSIHEDNSQNIQRKFIDYNVFLLFVDKDLEDENLQKFKDLIYDASPLPLSIIIILCKFGKNEKCNYSLLDTNDLTYFSSVRSTLLRNTVKTLVYCNENQFQIDYLFMDLMEQINRFAELWKIQKTYSNITLSDFLLYSRNIGNSILTYRYVVNIKNNHYSYYSKQNTESVSNYNERNTPNSDIISPLIQSDDQSIPRA